MSQQNLVPSQSSQADYQTKSSEQTIEPEATFQRKRSLCPCCWDVLLQHVNRSGVYQLCPSCRQEMPDLQAIQFQHHDRQTTL